MKGTAFKESNFLLKAGDNPNTEDIPACLCKDPQTGQDFIFSRFKLTDEEIEKIRETGHLYIGVMGRGWPPMLPSVFNPFKEFGDESFKPYEL